MGPRPAGTSSAHKHGAEVFFLERDRFEDLAVGELEAVRCDHKLVFAVVRSVDNRDATPLEANQRMANTEDIGVNLLSIRGQRSGDETVVDRV